MNNYCTHDDKLLVTDYLYTSTCPYPLFLNTPPLYLPPPTPKVRDTVCIDMLTYRTHQEHWYIGIYRGLLLFLLGLQKFQLKEKKKERVKEKEKKRLSFFLHLFRWATSLSISKPTGSQLSTQFCGLGLTYYLQLPVFLYAVVSARTLTGLLPDIFPKWVFQSDLSFTFFHLDIFIDWEPAMFPSLLSSSFPIYMFHYNYNLL